MISVYVIGNKDTDFTKSGAENNKAKCPAPIIRSQKDRCQKYLCQNSQCQSKLPQEDLSQNDRWAKIDFAKMYLSPHEKH